MVDVFDFVVGDGKAMELTELSEDARDVDELVVGEIQVDEALEVAQSVDLDVVHVIGRHVEMSDGGSRRKSAAYQRFQRIVPTTEIGGERKGFMMKLGVYVSTRPSVPVSESA